LARTPFETDGSATYDVDSPTRDPNTGRNRTHGRRA
jgi:hypothetical protein